jgi:hypothetical protein
MKAAPLRVCLRMSACVVMMLASSIALHAQSTYTGKLSGEVTDSSGAIIVGAKITLTDQVTNVQTLATADSKGVYVLTSLRPAT